MRVFRIFGCTVCILQDSDRYFLRSKRTQEEWEQRVKWLSFQSQRSVQNYRSASFAYGNAVCELNTTKQVLHETLEQLEKCREKSEEYRKMHADELQKRLELSDRISEMEKGCGRRMIDADKFDKVLEQREALVAGEYGSMAGTLRGVRNLLALLAPKKEEQK